MYTRTSEITGSFLTALYVMFIMSIVIVSNDIVLLLMEEIAC